MCISLLWTPCSLSTSCPQQRRCHVSLCNSTVAVLKEWNFFRDGHKKLLVIWEATERDQAVPEVKNKCRVFFLHRESCHRQPSFAWLAACDKLIPSMMQILFLSAWIFMYYSFLQLRAFPLALWRQCICYLPNPGADMQGLDRTGHTFS